MASFPISFFKIIYAILGLPPLEYELQNPLTQISQTILLEFSLELHLIHRLIIMFSMSLSIIYFFVYLCILNFPVQFYKFFHMKCLYKLNYNEIFLKFYFQIQYCGCKLILLILECGSCIFQPILAIWKPIYKFSLLMIIYCV